MDDTARRLEALYGAPTAAAMRDRIELGRPASYPEENLVLGRRDEKRLLMAWLGDRWRRDPDRPQVIDAGCGRARLALDLAAAGARVLAVDLVPRFSEAARRAHLERQIALLVADLRELVGAVRATDVVLREVVQDYTSAEQSKLFERLATSSARRIYLTLPLESRWSLVLRGLHPEGLGGVVDPTELLRTAHLLTPYRLTRQREVKRRNFRSLVVELSTQA